MASKGCLGLSDVHLFNEYENWIFQRDIFFKCHEVESNFDEQFAKHLLILHSKLCVVCSIEDHHREELHCAGATAERKASASLDESAASSVMLPQEKKQRGKGLQNKGSPHGAQTGMNMITLQIKEEPQETSSEWWPGNAESIASHERSHDHSSGLSGDGPAHCGPFSQHDDSLYQPSSESGNQQCNPSGDQLDQLGSGNSEQAKDSGPHGAQTGINMITIQIKEEPQESSSEWWPDGAESIVSHDRSHDQSSGLSGDGPVSQPDNLSDDDSLYQPSSESGDQQCKPSGDQIKLQPGTSHDQLESGNSEETEDSDAQHFVCTVCGIDFTTPVSFAQHHKNYHGYTGDLPTTESSHDEFMKFLNERGSNVLETDSTCGNIASKMGKQCDKKTLRKGNYSDDDCKTCKDSVHVNQDDLTEEEYGCDVSMNGKPFIDKCGRSSNDSTIYQRCTHSHVRLYECDVCGKLFTKSHLKYHKYIHTGEKPFPCDVCGKAFSDPSSLRAHKGIHTGVRRVQKRQKPPPKQYVCDICGKALSSSGNLKSHRHSHTGEKPFVCDVCGKGFGAQGDLNKHNKHIHNGVPRNYPKRQLYECDVCNKTFITAAPLETHKRIHTGETPFACDFCGKAFSNMGDCKRHINVIHSSTKQNKIQSSRYKYECDVCGKFYISPGKLKHHKYTHTGEKPFLCDVCGKAFSNPSFLNEHKIIHTVRTPPVKRHACDVCGKAFAKSGHLTGHKRIHTGERPFDCDVCGKAFKERSTLSNHKKSIHGVLTKVKTENKT